MISTVWIFQSAKRNNRFGGYNNLQNDCSFQLIEKLFYFGQLRKPMVSNVWLLQSAQWTNCFGGSCIFLIFSQLRKRRVSTIWLLQLAKRANRLTTSCTLLDYCVSRKDLPFLFLLTKRIAYITSTADSGWYNVSLLHLYKSCVPLFKLQQKRYNFISQYSPNK